MVDTDSSIAWHRARIKANKEDLADYESGHRSAGDIVGSRKIDATPAIIAELKRKITESEKLIAAYEKHNAKKA